MGARNRVGIGLSYRLAQATQPELEFFKSQRGLGTEEEEGYRTGPPGHISWRNLFLGKDSGAPYTFKNTGSGGFFPWNRFSGSLKVQKFGLRSLDGGGVSAVEGNYLDADLLENHSGQSPVWARPPSPLPRHRKSALADQVNADR
jgi:hypothetical protein